MWLSHILNLLSEIINREDVYPGCKRTKWFHQCSKAPVWALEKISDQELNWDELAGGRDRTAWWEIVFWPLWLLFSGFTLKLWHIICQYPLNPCWYKARRWGIVLVHNLGICLNGGRRIWYVTWELQWPEHPTVRALQKKRGCVSKVTLSLWIQHFQWTRKSTKRSPDKLQQLRFFLFFFFQICFVRFVRLRLCRYHSPEEPLNRHWYRQTLSYSHTRCTFLQPGLQQQRMSS